MGRPSEQMFSHSPTELCFGSPLFWWPGWKVARVSPAGERARQRRAAVTQLREEARDGGLCVNPQTGTSSRRE